MVADHEVVRRAVEALREVLGERLVSAVLFGSRARGDDRPESDWDLLVLAEGLPENPFDRSLFLKRIVPPECRGAISFLAKSPKEFEAGLASVYLDVALDGRILFDSSGYAAGRLRSLRRLIEEAGLYRERTESGDWWRWKQEPAYPWSLDWKE